MPPPLFAKERGLGGEFSNALKKEKKYKTRYK
jgi:hypothetical protein